VSDFRWKLGSTNLPIGGQRVSVTAADSQVTSVDTDDATKCIKFASAIPTGLPSMESGSFGPSKLRLGGEDGVPGMHLELLCQV
jgi:hypothetical protein